MKILYITQYFAPEIGATTNRALANVRYLASKGHQVTVLTEMPNHPHGIYFRSIREDFILEKKWKISLLKGFGFIQIQKRILLHVCCFILHLPLSAAYVELLQVETMMWCM